MRIDGDVMEVLDRCEVRAGGVVMPRLDREAYRRVDKVLRAAGGRWDREAAAHLFGGDPGEVLDALLATGEVIDARRALGAFMSPPAVVEAVAAAASVGAGMAVLEPSAGMGALAIAARDAGGVVDCVEVDPARAATLRGLGLASVTEGDFETAETPRASYDRVVMNPPFARGAEARHITRALGRLAPGGRLVAVASAAVLERRGGAYALLEATLEGFRVTRAPLPDSSFARVGTSVRTALVVAQAA